MIIVVLNGNQYPFRTMDEARQFQYQYGGRLVMQQQQYQQQQHEEPQPQREPRMHRPAKSIVANMIGKNSGRNAYRIPRFDPRKPSKYDYEED